MNLRDLIRQYADIEDFDEAAVAVCQDLILHHRKEAVAVLLPVVRDEIRRMRRLPVAAEEVEARVSADPLAARRALLAESVWVPDAGLIPWGQATAEQHRAAAAFWRHQAGQLTERADLHNRAASEIEAAGVGCLDELAERGVRQRRRRTLPKTAAAA